MHDIFVFEDNGPENGLPGLDEKYTPSSELLLGSFNGQNMRFLNGVGHAFDKLLRIAGQDGNSRYIVFYDVSPNNKNTINGYRGLVERCKLFQNIYVIPIICIEYYITHMMDKFGILQHNEDVDPFIMYLVSTFDWKKFLHTYRGGMYEQCYKEDLKDGKLPRAIRSLEKSYKYILEKQPWECLKNSNSGIHNKRGYFYKNDCNCKDCIWLINI